MRVPGVPCWPFWLLILQVHWITNETRQSYIMWWCAGNIIIFSVVSGSPFVVSWRRCRTRKTPIRSSTTRLQPSQLIKRTAQMRGIGPHDPKLIAFCSTEADVKTLETSWNCYFSAQPYAMLLLSENDGFQESTLGCWWQGRFSFGSGPQKKLTWSRLSHQLLK